MTITIVTTIAVIIVTTITIIIPRGSKYLILFEDSGPKNHALHGIWNQSPELLGTSILWDSKSPTSTQKLVEQVASAKPSSEPL